MYSIVIPVYNVKPEFLIQCLESILFENVVPIEVIIVMNMLIKMEGYK